MKKGVAITGRRNQLDLHGIRPIKDVIMHGRRRQGTHKKA